MKRIVWVLALVTLWSCQKPSKQFATQVADYNRYLQQQKSDLTSKNYEVWNAKIKPDSIQTLSLGVAASHYNYLFQATGNIENLKRAEKALEKAVSVAHIGKSGYLRALARNYISQHRFDEALPLAKEAEALGSDLLDSEALLFDIHMELGNYETAEFYLNRIRNMSSFDYLIRVAKWNDFKGDLATTLLFMEKAKSRAELARNRGLQLWTYTNLADYYGHAGKLEASYEHYLKALAIDPFNAYAKKGIAWIVYSYERNPKEALRILNTISKGHTSPDYELLKAEIAAYMNNPKSADVYLQRYWEAMNNKAYGAMYNSHQIALMIDENETKQKALQLAQEEVKLRATPETYSQLAYCWYKNGDLKKAIQIIEDQVVEKTSEPVAYYQMAKIYDAIEAEDRVVYLKNELEDAIYELGPSYEKLILELSF